MTEAGLPPAGEADRAAPGTSRPEAGLTTRLVGGSVWAIGGQLAVLAASFLATPFVVRQLEPALYGLLALIQTLLSYVGLASLGMTPASTRFGSEAFVRDDGDEEVAVVWTSLLIAVVPALLAAAVAIVTAHLIAADVLGLPAHVQDQATTALRIASIGFVGRSVYGCLNTPQVVRLRWDLVTLIDAGTTVAQLAAVPIVLAFGGGLVAAVTVSTVAEGVRIVLHLLVSRRLQPRLFHVRIRRALVGPLLRFGGAVVAAGALAIPLMSLERLFLARYASTASLAFYSLAATAAAVLTLVPVAVCQPLLPGFTRLHAAGDRAGLQELYGRAVRGILLLGVPAAVVLCVAARPGLSVWAGADYARESTELLYVLLAGVVIHGLAYVPYNLFLAADRARVVARLSVVELALYIPLAAWLTRRGAMGAATAWTVRAGLDTVVLFVLVRRSIGMRFAPLPGDAGRFAVAVIPIALCAAAALAFTDSLAGRAPFVVVGMASYGWMVWKGVLSDRERAWIRGLREGGWRELVQSGQGTGTNR